MEFPHVSWINSVNMQWASLSIDCIQASTSFILSSVGKIGEAMINIQNCRGEVDIFAHLT
jgi:hypothetical protein